MQHGSPVLSPIISQLGKGRANATLSKGVSRGAAVPVSFDQVAQLLQYLHAVSLLSACCRLAACCQLAAGSLNPKP